MRPDPLAYEAILTLALAEDIGPGDLTTDACVPPDRPARARIVSRVHAIFCGGFLAAEVMARLDPGVRVAVHAPEGARVTPDETLVTLEGSARAILKGERTLLNFLQRLSGVATLAGAFVAALEGTGASLCDTRKTTPGLRALEKYAVRVGGGRNHRFGLFDGVLIKENHIRAAGSITSAVAACRAGAHHLARVEVEVTSLEELKEALSAGADVVMLDNFTPDQVRRAAALTADMALLEVSGGITLANVRLFADMGARLVSVGALTHSAPAADLSLLFDLRS